MNPTNSHLIQIEWIHMRYTLQLIPLVALHSVRKLSRYVIDCQLCENNGNGHVAVFSIVVVSQVLCTDAPIWILVLVSANIYRILNIDTSVKSITLANITLALISVLQLATTAMHDICNIAVFVTVSLANQFHMYVHVNLNCVELLF